MATVQKRGNSFRIRSSCGYDINGRQIIKSTTWTPSPGMTARQIEKELERQKVLFDEKCRAGLCLDDNITFHDFCVKWFAEYAEPNLAPKTVAGYKNYIRRAYTALGHKKLSRIKPAHIMEFYQNLREVGVRGDVKYKSAPAFADRIKALKTTKAAISESTGLSINTVYQATRGETISPATAEKIAAALDSKKEHLFVPVGDDKPLSDKTVSEYHRLLHVILKTAMQWQYIPHNPCDMVTPPKVKRAEAASLDEVQTAELFRCLEGEPIKARTMILLLVYSGLRRGELCGLYWEDVDSDKKLLSVKVFQYEIGKEYIEDSADLCDKGFHACENPLDCLSYYAPEKSRYCEVELDANDQTESDSKRVGNRIKIITEIGLKGIIEGAVKFVFERCKPSKISSATTGIRANSAVGHKNAIAAALGINSAAKGVIGSYIVLAEWKQDEKGEWQLLTVMN